MTAVRSLALVGFLASSLVLSGCSIDTSGPATSEPAVTETSQPAPTNPAAAGPLDGVEALQAFVDLSKRSCEAAMTKGLVEETNQSDKMIMVPKDQAYKDNSAVYVGSDGTSEIIYETDYFLTCGDALYFWQIEEAGEPLPTDLIVTSEPTASGVDYQVTRLIERKRITYVYKEKDGLITSVNIPSIEKPELSLIFTMTYAVSAEDRALLEQVIDKG